MNKQRQVFTDYLGSVRREMETKGDIKIYQETLAKLDEGDDAEDAPNSQQLQQQMLQQQIQQQIQKQQQQQAPPTGK